MTQPDRGAWLGGYCVPQAVQMNIGMVGTSASLRHSLHESQGLQIAREIMLHAEEARMVNWPLVTL